MISIKKDRFELLFPEKKGNFQQNQPFSSAKKFVVIFDLKHLGHDEYGDFSRLNYKVKIVIMVRKYKR